MSFNGKTGVQLLATNAAADVDLVLSQKGNGGESWRNSRMGKLQVETHRGIHGSLIFKWKEQQILR